MSRSLIYIYVTELFDIDLRTKISTLITPLVILYLWIQVQKKISINQKVYDKKEMIYLEFFGFIETVFSSLLQDNSAIKKDYNNLVNCYVLNKLYISDNISTTYDKMIKLIHEIIEKWKWKDFEMLIYEIEYQKYNIERTIRKELQLSSRKFESVIQKVK